jgi:hypothetical protein
MANITFTGKANPDLVTRKNVKNLGWLLAHRHDTIHRVEIENGFASLFLFVTGESDTHWWKFVCPIASETVMWKWVERYLVRQCGLRQTYNYRTDNNTQTDTMIGTQHRWVRD